MRWIGGLAVLCLVLSGCDLFRTREPAPPTAPSGTWEAPRVPLDVLDNLSMALRERNAANYLLSFDRESFAFEMEPAVLQRYPALADWGYAQEADHIGLLFSPTIHPADSPLAVVFMPGAPTVLGDSAELRADYELVAVVTVAGAPRYMAGQAEFFLRMGSEGYWQICRWRDTRTREQSTWSDLKSLVRR